jgi:hypothetical protein
MLDHAQIAFEAALGQQTLAALLSEIHMANGAGAGLKRRRRLSCGVRWWSMRNIRKTFNKTAEAFKAAGGGALTQRQCRASN